MISNAFNASRPKFAFRVNRYSFLSKLMVSFTSCDKFYLLFMMLFKFLLWNPLAQTKNKASEDVFTRWDVNHLEHNFRSSRRVTQIFGRNLRTVWISILFIQRKFLSPVVLLVTLIKSFKHFHQLKQKCLWKPQVNGCSANIYSHKSHVIN